MRRFMALVMVLVMSMTVSAADLLPPTDVSSDRYAPAADTPEAIRATLAMDVATWYNDKDGDKVFDSLTKRLATGPQPIIVTFVEGTDVEAAMDDVASRLPGLEPYFVYHHYGGFAARLDLAQVNAIASLPEVRQIEWSQPGEPELDTATVSMGARAAREHLGVDGDLDGVLEEATGQDVVVSIMDTGFDGAHVDLEGKFVHFEDWGWCKENDMEAPCDSGSHGTHVASIVGGWGRGDERYTGVAPGAAFVGWMITNGPDHPDGTGSKAGALAGIDWILGHPEAGVRINTISFGFGTTVDGTDALELAMDKLFENDVLPFKSTGNSGPERGTVTIPGGSRGIIGTANMGDPGTGGMHLRTSSSRGPTEDGRIKPDIAAPGTAIMAAKAQEDGSDPKEYTEKTGTSMASPFAAGVAALVMDADPSLTAAQVKEILFTTAQDWGRPGHDIDYGHGAIDALAAVQKAMLQKAMREGRGYDAIAAINVSAPQVPYHQHGIIRGADARDGIVEATFEVKDGGQPLGISFIVNGTDAAPCAASPTGFRYCTPQRVARVAIVPPGGSVEAALLGEGATSLTGRQTTVQNPAPQEGTWTLAFMSLVGGDEIYWDVSAGLPEGDLLPWLLPDEAEYRLTVPPAEDQEAPGMPPVALLAILALLAHVRRRG